MEMGIRQEPVEWFGKRPQALKKARVEEEE
jgi:hypothetical protein